MLHTLPHEKQRTGTIMLMDGNDQQGKLKIQEASVQICRNADSDIEKNYASRIKLGKVQPYELLIDLQLISHNTPHGRLPLDKRNALHGKLELS